MSLIKTWAPHFQSNIRMRGRAYHAAGKVKRLPVEEGEIIRALVTGSRSYTVVIRGEGSTASAQCNCPFFAGGSYCKHIWAAILDAQYNPLEPRPDDGSVPADLDQPSLRPPKARKRADGAPAARRGEAAWIGRLSLLRTPAATMGAGPSAASPFGHGQVCYTISPELSQRHRGLVVLLRQRDPTQTGWSRFKRLKLTPAGIEEIPDPLDRELCALILAATSVPNDDGGFRSGNEMMQDAFRLPRGAAAALLRRMIQTERCFLDGDEHESSPLTWAGDEPWVLWLTGDAAGDELSVTTELRRGEEAMPIHKPGLLVGGVDGLVIYGNVAAPFDDRGATRWVSQFRDDYRFGDRPTPIRVPTADVPRFLDRLYRLPQLPEIDLPEGIGRREKHVAPLPHLEIFGPDGHDQAIASGTPRSQLIARLWFGYEDHRVRPGQDGRYVQDKPGVTREPPPAQDEDETRDRDDDHEPPEESTPEIAEAEVSEETPVLEHPSLIRRDIPREREAAALLATLGFRHHPNNGTETMLLAARQMPAAVGALLARGWHVTADQRVIHNPGPPRLSITSGIDWFELHGTLQYQTANGEQLVSLPDVLAALHAGKKMITLDDGSEGLLPEAWLEQQGLLAAMGKVHDDHVRFKNSQAVLLDTLLSQQDLVEVDAKFEAARQQLRQFDGIKPIEPAPTFQGSLRGYQCEGLGWLAFLRWFGMGGVLADDMGLGKTIQVLAMLDARANPVEAPAADAPPRLPTLIIVPRSVVFNWIDEAAHFAPRLRVQAYTGAERGALRDAFTDHDVIVTSYGLMRRDIAELRKHRFDYVVLDEAQAIKNPASQSAKAARLLESNHRLALTGTPVENHLGDLWSIFEFLNPGMLGSGTRFGMLVRGEDGSNAAEGNGHDAATAGAEPRPPVGTPASVQIARALRPFILRRTKKQVLTELPEKTEQTIVCELEPEQRKLYDQLRLHYRGTLLGRLDAASGGNGASGNSGGTMMVLEALLRLRQAACHPGLIDPKRADEPSAKLEVLLDRLADLIEEGHKALVFSQFTSMLALVRRRLDERKIVYEYLDGQTRHRKKHVQRFQTDPDCPLFLISLKAGGLGLNLTAAEYVFILDPWWNPAVEAQAIDRIHRIGQTRHVFAYRLICRDTVEQRIAELQDKKKKLADAIVGGQESVLSSLTRDDLDQLLS